MEKDLLLKLIELLVSKEDVKKSSEDSSMIGKMVITRSGNAGNLYGELVEVREKSVVLKNARRLWYWKCKEGFTLEDIANYGIDSDSKVTSPVSLLEIREEKILILPVTKEAEKSIDSQKNYNPN